MMRKLVKILTALALTAWALALLLLPKLTSQAVTDGLRLCAGVLLPSLFPFFVCTNLLCALGLTAKLSKLMRPLMQPLFRVGGNGAGALIMGLIGGYPAGAQNVASLYESKQISKDEAAQLLKFCCACGPAFLIGVVGTQLCSNAKTGLILYLIHLIGAILTGIFLRPQSSISAKIPSEKATSVPSFSAAFTKSVQKAGASALQVCMFVVTFRVLSELLLYLLPNALDLPVAGILELSTGIAHLADAPLPQTATLTLASFFAGFGGFGVYAQTAALLTDAGLPIHGYLSAKLLHGSICAGITFVVFSLFPTFADATPVSTFPVFSPIVPIVVGIWLLCGLICHIFHKVASRNLQNHRV
ncbi:MAG: sporulation protein [Oscillospiraceae bacterium]|nr:sporulation protein [Oscillospiraceae bacterium]